MTLTGSCNSSIVRPTYKVDSVRKNWLLVLTAQVYGLMKLKLKLVAIGALVDLFLVVEGVGFGGCIHSKFGCEPVSESLLKGIAITSAGGISGSASTVIAKKSVSMETQRFR